MKTERIKINKKSLTITLTGEDAAYDFRVMAAAPKMYSVLTDYAQWLRTQIKYQDKNELEPAREEFHRLLSEEGLDLYREDGP